MSGDSQLWNPKQIPRPTLSPPVQNQVDADDDEDTLDMRELMEAIDTHAGTL